MSKADSFIAACLSVEERFRDSLDVIEVYAFRTTGSQVQAFSMIITRDETRERPLTVTMYYLSDGTVISVLGLDSEILDRLEVKCKCEKTLKLNMDMYVPERIVSLTDVTEDLLKRLPEVREIVSDSMRFVVEKGYRQDKLYLIDVRKELPDESLIANILQSLKRIYSALERALRRHDDDRG